VSQFITHVGSLLRRFPKLKQSRRALKANSRCFGLVRLIYCLKDIHLIGLHRSCLCSPRATISPIAVAHDIQHIDFSGRRPGLVIFAAMVALVVNWTTTIGIFLITCESVVMQRTYILRVCRCLMTYVLLLTFSQETDILGVCLTALFALPSVRAILPGAPDFGAIIGKFRIALTVRILNYEQISLVLYQTSSLYPSARL
jgi:hypothetical protein